MTRGKWVALAVGLAVIGVIVLNGPAVWRAVPYSSEVLFPVKLYPGLDRTRLNRSDPVRAPDYIVIWQKRGDWIPGQRYIIRCSFCLDSDHDLCVGVMNGEWSRVRPSEASFHVFDAAFRCSCPHPSHAEESE